jgi:hypothetical protein
VPDRIIHRNQAAFIGGRNIMTNILALHEILHDTKRRGKLGVALKLDIEKRGQSPSGLFDELPKNQGI